MRSTATLRLGVLVLLLCGGILLALRLGSLHLSTAEILQSFSKEAPRIHHQVIMNIRLPRVLTALLVGMNLAVSGAILQAVMRNPLADPGIIGVSSGAGFVSIFIMLLFPRWTHLMMPAAFSGAVLACSLVYLLSWKNGLRPRRIILSGIAVNSFFGAGISGLMIFYSDRIQGALLYMSGSMAATTWGHLFRILPYGLVGLCLAMTQSEKLNLLLLGDDSARGLGLSVSSNRLFLSAVACLLAASSVSVVGLLGFVGLIVPHIARLIFGSNYRILLPASSLMGALILLLSDTLARTIFSPVEIPVGIVMAGLGAPFFLFLLRRTA